MLSKGLEAIINLQGREMTIERGVTTATVKIAPSNYHRNRSVVEEVVSEGKEFVVAKSALDAVSFPTPRRGDVIVDPELGVNSVLEVIDMVFLGRLIGYRLRTD